MKKGIIIFLIVVTLAGGIWYLYSSGKLTALSDGAYDDNDRATYNNMMQAVKGSEFSADADYLEKSYKEGFAPGKSMAPKDAYGTINGKQTMSGGLTSATYTAFLSIYCVDNYGTPKPGITREKAQAAMQLAQQIAHMWEQYRNETVQATIK